VILQLRIVLSVLAIVFTYFFGETLENFLFEVIRFFVAVEPSNALFFNVVHMILSVIPLLILGGMVSISFGGEADLRNRLWGVVSGVVLALIALRVFQLWWLFRGGFGSDFIETGETFSVGQLYFIENIFPYILIGVLACLVVTFIEIKTYLCFVFSALSASSAFLWLLLTKKIQNIDGIPQLSMSLLVCMVSALVVTAGIKLIHDRA